MIVAVTCSIVAGLYVAGVVIWEHRKPQILDALRRAGEYMDTEKEGRR